MTIGFIFMLVGGGLVVHAQEDVMNDNSLLLVQIITAVVGLVGIFYLFRLMGNPESPKVLPLDDFQPFPLIRKDVISHDTCRYTLGLPQGHSLGLPIGQHIALKFKDDQGKTHQRSYTPVTDDSRLGEVELVVKVYRPLPPKFPNGGMMSQHLDSLNIGDTILVKGPKGHIHYLGRGKFTTKPLGKPMEERYCHQIGMMAGGTGVTPMLQILQAIFINPKYKDDQTKVNMIYANQTPNDILVRKELEEFSSNFSNRFKLWYTVDKITTKEDDIPSEWKYDVGFITTKMIKEHLLFDGDNSKTQFFMCGPPPMIKFACIPALQECGMTEKNWSVF